MRKNLWLFGALISAFIWSSCGGSKNKPAEAYSAEEVQNAKNVVNYYETSLALLKNVVKPKNVNAVLGYMEQQGKASAATPVMPPAIFAKDTAQLMNPGPYFDASTRKDLRESFAGLFSSRDRFYTNLDKYLSLMKTKKNDEAGKLLETNYQLSTEMAEYKQNIFDILNPLVEKAQKVLLAGNPMRDQMLAMTKMTATMQSIVNLYTRRHLLDGVRLDVKVSELASELAAAKKLPAVAGQENEMQTFNKFLSNAEAFLNKIQDVRSTGTTYTDADYEMLTSTYGISVI